MQVDIYWTKKVETYSKDIRNTRYIEQNDPQSSYALHILNNKHDYGTITDAVTLLKHINGPTLLLPYEQLYIQTYHHHKQLIPEQHVDKVNPMYQLIHDIHNTSHPHKQSHQ